MSKTFGAPLGGTMRGGHQGVESLAPSLITPPNLGGGGGICFPSMVVVALGEPNVPVTCCASAILPAANKLETASPPNATFQILAPRYIGCLLACTTGLAAFAEAGAELIPT